MSYYPEFAELLNRYLIEEERTAAWLAKRLGMHHGTVSRWRNGESRPDKPETIIRIADSLAVYEQARRQELLVAAGYGYQPPSLDKPASSKSEWPASEKVVREPDQGLLSAGLWLKPPSYSQLVGIEEHLTHLSGVLSRQQAPWLLCISGLGGIGKTSLANALVDQVMAQGSFKKVGWVSTQLSAFNLMGVIKQVAESALSVPALVEELVRQLLGVRGSLSYSQMVALLHSHLKEQPHLIVIDNLETLADLEHLLPILRHLAAPSKFLLTSRQSLFGEPDLYHFSLPELSQSDALQLVRQEAKVRYLPHLVECDDENLLPIYKTVGGNPLALRLIVGQLHILNLSAILKEVAQGGGEEAENLYSYIYQQAWDHLDQMTRQLFLMMLLVTERGSTLDELEHISQIERRVLYKSLRLLASRNLIDVQQKLSATRYTIHRLTRTFLQKQIATEKDSALLFCTYLTQSIQELCRRIEERASPILPTELQEQALHSLNYAFKLPSVWAVTRKLLLALAPRMEQAGASSEWMNYLEGGIAQSQQQKDMATEALLQYHLGLLFKHQALFEQAHRLLEASATHFERLGKPNQQARALNRLAYVARCQQQLEEARELVQKTLHLCGERQEEIAYSHFVLGTIAFDEYDWQKASHHFSKSLALWKATNNQRFIAWGLTNLGTALRKLEQYEEAINVYKKAISLLETIQDPVYQAVARMNLGNVYLKLNQPHKALNLYALAEVIFSKTQATLFLTQVTFNKGIAYEKLEEWKKAKEAYLTCIAQRQQLADIASLLNAMDRLGVVYHKQAQNKQAISTFQDALKRLTQIQNQPAYEHLLSLLSEHLHETIEQSAS